VIETPMLTVEDSARCGAFVKRLFQAFVEGGNQVYLSTLATCADYI